MVAAFLVIEAWPRDCSPAGESGACMPCSIPGEVSLCVVDCSQEHLEIALLQWAVEGRLRDGALAERVRHGLDAQRGAQQRTFSPRCLRVMEVARCPRVGGTYAPEGLLVRRNHFISMSRLPRS
jgi:hypothetical protein